MSARAGLILFAHGSRDPGWRKPIEAVAERVAARSPELAVTCAYLELDRPDLAQAAEGLVSAGATSLVVVPMFLGVGKHAREDLPVLIGALRERYPQVSVRLTPALGEQSDILDFLAEAVARIA